MRVCNVPALCAFSAHGDHRACRRRLVEGFSAGGAGKTGAVDALPADAPRRAHGTGDIPRRPQQRSRPAAADRAARRCRRGRTGLRAGRLAPETKGRSASRARGLAAPAAACRTDPRMGEPLNRAIRPAPLVVGGPASALALADDLARLMDDMPTRKVTGARWTGWSPMRMTNTGNSRCGSSRSPRHVAGILEHRRSNLPSAATC